MVQIAESCFKRAIMNGFGVCGGACFYSYCLCFAWKFILEKKVDRQIEKCLRNMKALFVRFLKNLIDYEETCDCYINMLDGHFYSHADKCDCGAFKVDPNLAGVMKIRIIDDDHNFQFVRPSSILSGSIVESTPCLIDCHESKTNALQLAHRLFITFSQIGGFISV